MRHLCRCLTLETIDPACIACSDWQAMTSLLLACRGCGRPCPLTKGRKAALTQNKRLLCGQRVCKHLAQREDYRRRISVARRRPAVGAPAP